MPSSPSKAKPHMHRRFSLQRHTPQRNGYGNVTMSWYAHTTDTARRCSSFENLYCVDADGCWRVVDRNYNTICCTCPRVSGSRTSTCLLSLFTKLVFTAQKRSVDSVREKFFDCICFDDFCRWIKRIRVFWVSTDGRRYVTGLQRHALLD